MPRKLRPTGGMAIGPIPEFGATAITAKYLDDIEKDIRSNIDTTQTPKWVLDRLVYDFKQSLIISTGAPKGIPYNQLNEYDADEVPGAGFLKLNIDPRDWKKKGAANMVKDTLLTWGKGVIATDDFQTKTRQIFWKELIKSDLEKASGREGLSGEITSAAKNFATGSVKEYTDRFKETHGGLLPGTGGTPGRVTNPLALNGLGIYEKGVPANFADINKYNKDVYADVGEKLLSFVSFSEAGPKRDLTHDAFLGASLNAITTEINQKIGARASDGVKSFIQRSELANSLGTLGFNKGEASGEIVKALGTSINSNNLAEIQKNLGTLEKQVEKAKNALESAKRGIGPDVNNIYRLEKIYGQGFVAECENHLAGLERVIKSDNFKAVKSATATGGVGAFLNVDELATRSKDLFKNLNISSGTGNVLKGGGLTGGDILVDSTHRKLARSLAGEFCDPEKAVHQAVVDNNLVAQRMFFIINRAERERAPEAVQEFAEKAAKGFSNTYIWTNRLGKVTDNGIYSIMSPKDLVLSGLARTQNFGMVLNEEALKNKSFYKKDDTIFNAAFGNRFTVNVSVGGKIQKIKVQGGEHFKLDNIGALNTMVHKYDIDKAAGKVKGYELEYLFAGKLDPITGKRTLQRLVNFDPITKKLTVGDEFKHLIDPSLLLPGLSAENQKKLDDLLKNMKESQDRIDTLRNYFQKRLGINHPLLNELEFWAGNLDPNGIRKGGVIGYLSKNSYIENISRRYLGLMEKTAKYLNKAQNIIFTELPLISPAIQFFASRAVAMENAAKKLASDIGRAVSKFLIKWAGKLGFQFLGSIAPIIGNLIAWVLAYLFEKIISLFSTLLRKAYALLQGFFKGDVSAVIAEFEKEQEKATKFALFILFMIALAYILFESVIGLIIPNFVNIGGIVTKDPFDDPIAFALSTFSPADKTRINGTMLQSFDWNIYLSGGAYPKPIPGGPNGPIINFPPVNCNGSKTLPPENLSSNAMTKHGYEIAQDLVRGFWCLFNHSPTLYPELWNEGLYQSDPNLSYSINDPGITNALFWCTWMVIKTHKKCDPSFQPMTGTSSMIWYLKQRGADYTLRRRADASINKIKAGDIIFYGHSDTWASGVGGSSDHVGIVYAKTSDGIYTVESNAGDVSFFLPTENCGSGSCPIQDTGRQGFYVLGFASFNGTCN